MASIAAAADISASTLARLIRGTNTPSATTVEKIAQALHTTPAHIAELLGIEVGELGWWSPPIEAHHMTGEQREVVSRLIIMLGKDGRDAGTAEAQKNPRRGKITRIHNEQALPVDQAAYDGNQGER